MHHTIDASWRLNYLRESPGLARRLTPWYGAQHRYLSGKNAGLIWAAN
jgi:hypothetical protein